MAQVSELIRSLLKKRGVEDDVAIEAFLHPKYEEHTHAAELLVDMDAAVARILCAIEENEHIAVYADFDCDGIPGAAVLSDFFAKIGYPNVDVYIPHRDKEGYGVHLEAIDTLIQRGVTLIITVDVGISAGAAVLHAAKKGVDMIITDHHEITDTLPSAVAVINPKRAPYPFPDLCGTAVAFKLVQALIATGKRLEMEMFVAIPEGWDKWLLDLVAIATVADMVPLVGESRTLAYWGLQVLRKSPRPGIIALCTQMRIRKEELTEDDIGFAIAPRVNAASRMDTPELAFRLLTTKDEKEADQIARELDALNASRKGLVASIVKEAKKTAHARFAPEEKVIVFGSVAWKPALLGLAANSIMDERGGMVCLWGKDANGALKGSCRSDGSVHVAQVFASAHDLFEAHGGHECAGGFTVSHEKVHTLHEDLAARLVNNYSSIPADGNTKMVTPDAHVSLREVSSALLTDITRLAPFGIGNPKPVFSFSRIRIESVKRFGKENNHLELSLACADHGTICRAYDFFKSPESFTEVPRVGGSARVLATIERDTYRRTLALRITDILPE